ncbi:MAG: hypothetical protein ACKVWV_09890 [Planctomycetota bacterium]
MLNKSVFVSLCAGLLCVGLGCMYFVTESAAQDGLLASDAPQPRVARTTTASAQSIDAAAGESVAARAPIAVGSDATDPAAAAATSEATRAHSQALKDGALRDLRAAVELSLSDQVDTVAILASTLALLEGATGVEGAPTTIPTGALVYTIVGADGGVQAEFRSTPTLDPDRRALSVRLTMPRPVDEYFLEGALREPPEVELMMVPGTDGELSGLIIHTSLMVAPETLQLGVELDKGRFIQGVNYWMNMLDAGDAVVRAHGMTNGRGDWWTSSVTIAGDWQTQMAHVQELSQFLLGMYAKTKS